MSLRACAGLGLTGEDPRDFLPKATRFLQPKNFIPSYSRTAFGGSECLDSTSVVINNFEDRQNVRGAVHWIHLRAAFSRITMTEQNSFSRRLIAWPISGRSN